MTLPDAAANDRPILPCRHRLQQALGLGAGLAGRDTEPLDAETARRLATTTSRPAPVSAPVRAAAGAPGTVPVLALRPGQGPGRFQDDRDSLHESHDAVRPLLDRSRGAGMDATRW